jgi:hypothetical protein
MTNGRAPQEVPGLGARLLRLLRQTRSSEGRRLTQLALAEKAHISRQTIGAAINSDRATPRTIRRLAKALCVQESALLADVDLQWEPEPEALSDDSTSVAGRELADFAASMDRIVRQLSDGTGAPLSPRAKIAILNGVAEAARLAGQTPPREYFDVLRKVSDEAANADRR